MGWEGHWPHWPRLGRFGLENRTGFSLFVLGWLLPWVVALHSPPPPWGGASFYGLGSGKGL